MRKFAAFLSLCFLVAAANPASNLDVFDGCGLNGTARSAALKRLNQLKNRYAVPRESDIDRSITLGAMLAPGDDRSRWSSASAAEITGYVLDVKPGGPETCNCGKKDALHSDTHIELVLHATDTSLSQTVVVEVTPRLRAMVLKNGTDWSTNSLRRQFRHKWITIRGWMLFDSQHANAAENTNPAGAKDWRATAWEIHPVTAIRLRSAG